MMVTVVALVAAAALLLDVGLLLYWMYTYADVRAGVRPPVYARQWSLVDVWAAGQFVVLNVVLVASGSALFLLPHPLSGSKPNMASIAALPYIAVVTLAQNALLFGIPVLLISLKYNESLSRIGLTWQPHISDLRRGITWGLGLFLMQVVVDGSIRSVGKLVLGPAFPLLEKIDRDVTAQALFKGNITAVQAVVLFICIAVVAPVGEETFFRGFLYNAAKHRFGVGGAVAITTVVFAVIHLGPLTILGILFMGVALAIAYEKSKSLWVTITMHAVNNGLVLALTVAGQHLK